jgi:hypothetical protein
VDEVAIKKMEKTLRDYYRKLEELESKKAAIAAIEKNEREVRGVLLDADQLIPSKGMVTRYSAAAGGGNGFVSDPTAQGYQEFTKSIEKFQNELVVLIQRKIKLKMQIMQIESSTDGITFALNLLEPLERKICEEYYGLRRKSNLQIGLALNLDEKSVRYRRKVINQKLADYLRVTG